MRSFQKLAIMAKLRPQESDAWPIAEEHNRIFVGWAPWKSSEESGVDRLSDRMLDLSELEDGWDRDTLREDRKERHVQVHRNLAHEIDAGSMVAVTRPEKGVVHLAPIAGRFELVDDPPWLEEYIDLRKEQGLDTEPPAAHAGDVCQTWPTGEWRSVPFPLVPGWITKSLISRNQICRIKDRPDGEQQAVDILRRLHEHGDVSVLFPNSESAEFRKQIRARLQTWLTPQSFEHFCCDLLQAMEPKRRWWPIGGSGDAGTDGIAVDEDGPVVAALQCKYSYSGDPRSLGRELRDRLAGHWDVQVDGYVATMFQDHEHDGEADGVTYLGPSRLADLLVDHWDEVPAARRLDLDP